MKAYFIALISGSSVIGKSTENLFLHQPDCSKKNGKPPAA
jgi:hypothetical protein